MLAEVRRTLNNDIDLISGLDGSNVEDLVTAGLDTPENIALDVAGGKVYWTDWTNGKIQRANLGGSNVEDLVTAADGLDEPYDIALCIEEAAPVPIGGIVVPVNKLGLVAPWMGLVTLAGLAGLGVVLVRRRGRA
jgi:hypothetical protein